VVAATAILLGASYLVLSPVPIDQITAQLPTVVRVLGDAWLRGEAWMVDFIDQRLPWYGRLETDLARLVAAGIPEARLISSYRHSLRTRPEIQKCIYEVHAAALLSECASSVELHAPKGDGSNRNFDIAVEIESTDIAVEVKTRKDEFPFNIPVNDEGVHGGSRATMDQHDAASLGFPSGGPPESTHRATPESTVVKQILQEALAQLPAGRCSIVVVGQIEGDIHNLEEALFGTEYVEMARRSDTGEHVTRWLRAPNGAFNSSGDEFNGIGGVIWIRLWRDGEQLNAAYRGYRNDRACSPLPDAVRLRLDAILRSRAQPGEE
jgi:hypothetical protein